MTYSDVTCAGTASAPMRTAESVVPTRTVSRSWNLHAQFALLQLLMWLTGWQATRHPPVATQNGVCASATAFVGVALLGGAALRQHVCARCAEGTLVVFQYAQTTSLAAAVAPAQLTAQPRVVHVCHSVPTLSLDADGALSGQTPSGRDGACAVDCASAHAPASAVATTAACTMRRADG